LLKTDSLPARYFSLGARKAGICFGNSPVYTGLRFNGINNHVKTTNIFDFSLFTKDDNQDRKTNGLSTSIFINEQHRNNGLSAGLIVNILEIQNGIAIGGIYNVVHKVNGMGISCLILVCDTIHGFALASVLSSYFGNGDKQDEHVLNGMAVAAWVIDVGTVNGVTISATNRSKKHHGLSIGLYNKTKTLRGVQLGLFNVVEDNPKGFRKLPFLNFHFGKKKSTDISCNSLPSVLAANT